MRREFSRLLKNMQISNFIKIHAVEDELFHADGQRHDKANCRYL